MSKYENVFYIYPKKSVFNVSTKKLSSMTTANDESPKAIYLIVSFLIIIIIYFIHFLLFSNSNPEIIINKNFEEIFDTRNPPKNVVILSSTLNKRYLFLLPFTVMSWKKLGVQAIVILVGQEDAFKNDKQARVTIKMLNDMKVYIKYIQPERLSPTSLSQIIRLFGAALPFASHFQSKNETIFISSDADLVVFHLENHIPNLLEGKKLHLYNSKCCDPINIPPMKGNFTVPMYPMGTIGATIQTWNEIMGFGKAPMTVKEMEDYIIKKFGPNFFHPNNEKNPELVGSQIWYADQSLISYKIYEWLKISQNRLSTSEHSEGPRRIDRIKWPEPSQFKNFKIENFDDCHQPTAAFAIDEWEKFKPFLEFAFENDTNLMETFTKYRQNFMHSFIFLLKNFVKRLNFF